MSISPGLIFGILRYEIADSTKNYTIPLNVVRIFQASLHQKVTTLIEETCTIIFSSMRVLIQGCTCFKVRLRFYKNLNESLSLSQYSCVAISWGPLSIFRNFSDIRSGPFPVLVHFQKNSFDQDALVLTGFIFNTF